LSAPFRFANDLHIDTRDSVIESQLLFRKGDPVSQRLFEETERNLRDRRYLREPSVRTVHCHDGEADVEVTVREVWTTNPGISFERTGGANAGGIAIRIHEPDDEGAAVCPCQHCRRGAPHRQDDVGILDGLLCTRHQRTGFTEARIGNE